jgi:hypothetical protein
MATGGGSGQRPWNRKNSAQVENEIATGTHLVSGAKF